MIRFIKKFAVFFIAALVLTFIWFKTAGAAETLDAARLEALAKRLNDFTSLEADFTQKRTLGAAGRTLTSTGTLSLTCRSRVTEPSPGSRRRLLYRRSRSKTASSRSATRTRRPK